MLAKQLIVTVSCLIVCNALSVGTVSDKQTKREASAGDLFPDWVPFKNKHGEELGEFVQVTKAKPKKRLAPPVNFVLKAVAEPEGDEYFEKGQGADNEDYFDKKEWSDLNRPASQVEADENKVNHTQLSEIDGVVNILTKKPNNPVVEALKKAKQQQAQQSAEQSAENSQEVKKNEEKGAVKTEAKPDESKTAESKKLETKRYEDDADYEEGSSEKKQESADNEQSENEAKKASILDSVDELKERHAEEQRFISEKVKDEEIYKEERERDKILAQLSQEEHGNNIKKPRRTPADYEEYEDKNISLEDKYKISPENKKTTLIPIAITPKRTNKRISKKDKTVETGKLSVFKNPQLYMVYDDDSNEEPTTHKPIKIRGPKPKAKNGLKRDKFSSKYSAATTNSDENERISLVPQENDAKIGEPTLFFPKKRKNKKRKNKYLTLPADSSVAETIAGNAAKQVAAVVDHVAGSAVVEALPTSLDSISDAVPQSSEKKEESKKEEDFHREKGGGKDYSAEHDEEHKEHGKKSYEGVHEETKSAKGHHDKESHLGEYDDNGGIDKYHLDEAGHYGIHHHEEHGKKQAKYEESGKHSKGHSTKGSHDIHKKEEYEKKIEFFEEEGDSGEEEKHGGYNQEHGNSEGGHFKQGDYHAGNEEHAKGESGDFSKGGHMHVQKGHKSASGEEAHGRHGHAHFEKEGADSGKKWIYHHGHPAKTANLIMIDRRAAKYYHGPQYYG